MIKTIINTIYYYLPYSKYLNPTENSLEIFQSIPSEVLLHIISNFSYHELGHIVKLSKHLILSLVAEEQLTIPKIMFNSSKYPFHERT